MKRSLTYFLCVVFIVTLVLSGCSVNEPVSEQPSQTSTPVPEATTPVEESNLTAPGELPIVKEKITLTAFVIPSHVDHTDFEDNEMTRWLEEQTNIRFEWETSTQQDGAQKLNLMLASGDYTDVILNSGFSAPQMLMYGNQGILIPLNDLIDEYGIGTQKVWENYPEALRYFTMTDGNIYSLPDVSTCYHCGMGSKFWMYQPWLDELGLNMPTTTDEFYDVLMAFKTQDPNGNGIADEIPFAGSMAHGRTRPDIFIMNSFIYTNDGQKYTQIVDGKVQPVYNTPEWKEGLTYLNKLVKDGLLAMESFTQDRNQLVAMGSMPDHHILGSGPGMHPGHVSAMTDGIDGTWNQFKVMNPLEGSDGAAWAYTGFAPYGTPKVSITSKSKDAEAAFRFFDYLYDDEVTLNLQWGLRGQYWDWAETGVMGINGEQAIWNRFTGDDLKEEYRNAKNYAWHQVSNVYYSPVMHSSRQAGQDRNNDLESILYDATERMEPHRAPMGMLLPPLSFDEDTAREVAELETVILGYVNEMMAKFITGDTDIEAGWDNYVRTLDGMGLDNFIQILQDGYDRYYQN